MIWAVLAAVAGLAMVVISAERLVEAIEGLAATAGWSVFVISVVFLGFDPENLLVGAASASQAAGGLAAGTVIGSAMVAVALAVGAAALLAPMRFERVPLPVVAVAAGALALLGLLSLDGELSRLDGAVLLAAYPLALWGLGRLARHGLDVRAAGVKPPDAGGAQGGVASAVLRLLGWLVVLFLGAEALVYGVRFLVDAFELSQTVIGMTVLALAISAEELARTVPAALRGRYEISIGNLVGSVLAFFLCNAGVIALIRPLELDGVSRGFALPYTIATVVIALGLLLTRRLPRWSGLVLIALYGGFAVGVVLV